MIGADRLLHQERARMAWPILVRRARAGGTPFTYRQIGDQIGVHWRAVGWFLGEIQEYCDRRQLPPLQALVVQKTSRLPGQGYHGSVIAPDEHARAVAAVQAYEWTLEPPDF